MSSGSTLAGGSPRPDSEAATGRWRAAGVLPYAVLDGTVLCMLGKEYSLAPSTTRLLVPQKTGIRPSETHQSASAASANESQYRCWWSDFGGGREADDASVVHTAAREWAEETIGVYGDGPNLVSRVENSAQDMRAQLCEKTASSESRPSLGPTFAVVSESYTMYVCAMPFVDTLIFQLARDDNDAEASVMRPHGTSRAECSSTTVDEDMRKLRRQCGEKRDFAWVSLHSLLVALGNGRTWLWDGDGQLITLLPRLGYALQTSGPTLLKTISEALLGSSLDLCTTGPKVINPANVDCAYRQGIHIITLPLPSHRAGGCSLHLGIRRCRRCTKTDLHLDNSACTEESAGDFLRLKGPASLDEVDRAISVLKDKVKVLPRFGDVRRAVLHRYSASSPEMGTEMQRCTLRDPFVLITFFCPTAASEARRWLNSSAGTSRVAGEALSTEQTGSKKASHIEVVAEFAFFEPKKRRRSSSSDPSSCPAGTTGRAIRAPNKVRSTGGFGQGGRSQTKSNGPRGAGRKSKLGVQPSRNAAAVAAD